MFSSILRKIWDSESFLQEKPGSGDQKQQFRDFFWIHFTQARLSTRLEDSDVTAVACIRNIHLIIQGSGLITAELIYVVRLIESNRRHSKVTIVTVDIYTEANVTTLE